MASNQTQGWTFNLDKVGSRDTLKDPLGFKAPTNDTVVRTSGKKSATHVEVLEKVMIYAPCLTTMPSRKLGSSVRPPQNKF